MYMYIFDWLAIASVLNIKKSSALLLHCTIVSHIGSFFFLYTSTFLARLSGNGGSGFFLAGAHVCNPIRYSESVMFDSQSLQIKRSKFCSFPFFPFFFFPYTLKSSRQSQESRLKSGCPFWLSFQQPGNSHSTS